jgi:hypothetical protein
MSRGLSKRRGENIGGNGRMSRGSSKKNIMNKIIMTNVEWSTGRDERVEVRRKIQLILRFEIICKQSRLRRVNALCMCKFILYL